MCSFVEVEVEDWFVVQVLTLLMKQWAFQDVPCSAELIIVVVAVAAAAAVAQIAVLAC